MRLLVSHSDGEGALPALTARLLAAGVPHTAGARSTAFCELLLWICCAVMGAGTQLLLFILSIL